MTILLQIIIFTWKSSLNPEFSYFAGGHFVCKLFDLFTPFSIGLVYLMYRIFNKVSIIKPVTSRPANSERYFFFHLNDRSFITQTYACPYWIFVLRVLMTTFLLPRVENTHINNYGLGFFRTTQELEFFISSEFNIRLYDKNSESEYFFFPPPKSEYFFSKKTINPPSSYMVVPLATSLYRTFVFDYTI